MREINKKDVFAYSKNKDLFEALRALKEEYTEEYSRDIHFDNFCFEVQNAYYQEINQYIKIFHDSEDIRLVNSDKPMLYHFVIGSTMTDYEFLQTAKALMPLDFANYPSLRALLKIYRHLSNSGSTQTHEKLRRHIFRVAETVYQSTGILV